MADVLTQLQDNFVKLMPHKLLEHKDIVNKTTHHPLYPIRTVFSAIEELFKFTDITRTTYTQL